MRSWYMWLWVLALLLALHAAYYTIHAQQPSVMVVLTAVDKQSRVVMPVDDILVKVVDSGGRPVNTSIDSTIREPKDLGLPAYVVMKKVLVFEGARSLNKVWDYSIPIRFNLPERQASVDAAISMKMFFNISLENERSVGLELISPYYLFHKENSALIIRPTQDVNEILFLKASIGVSFRVSGFARIAGESFDLTHEFSRNLESSSVWQYRSRLSGVTNVSLPREVLLSIPLEYSKYGVNFLTHVSVGIAPTVIGASNGILTEVGLQGLSTRDNSAKLTRLTTEVSIPLQATADSFPTGYGRIVLSNPELDYAGEYRFGLMLGFQPSISFLGQNVWTGGEVISPLQLSIPSRAPELNLISEDSFLTAPEISDYTVRAQPVLQVPIISSFFSPTLLGLVFSVGLFTAMFTASFLVSFSTRACSLRQLAEDLGVITMLFLWIFSPIIFIFSLSLAQTASSINGFPNGLAFSLPLPEAVLLSVFILLRPVLVPLVLGLIVGILLGILVTGIKQYITSLRIKRQLRPKGFRKYLTSQRHTKRVMFQKRTDTIFFVALGLCPIYVFLFYLSLHAFIVSSNLGGVPSDKYSVGLYSPMFTSSSLLGFPYVLALVLLTLGFALLFALSENAFLLVWTPWLILPLSGLGYVLQYYNPSIAGWLSPLLFLYPYAGSLSPNATVFPLVFLLTFFVGPVIMALVTVSVTKVTRRALRKGRDS
jgi:hypothetical protein